jgi:hypothetical protein
VKPIIPWIVGALLVLTACGPADDTDTPASSSTDTVHLAAQLAWEGQSEENKDALCLGLYAYGRDWAAREIARGGGQSEADALIAVALIETECDAR